MKNLRIVFMGTPDFAVASLSRLVADGHEIVGVITAPDRPAGRGRKLRESSVKQYALSQGLPVLQPTNLKDETFLTELRNLNVELQVVVAFRMLPKVVWAMPRYGTINLHASLLPDYRGAAPINWVLMNGETMTGVTTFFIDAKIDTGAIIDQKQVAIEPEETAGQLHDRLMDMGAKLVSETVKKIGDGMATTRIQSDSVSLHDAPKIDRDTCKVDWNADLATIYNHIRGLSPFPTAWTTLIDGAEHIPVKIYRSAKKVVDHDHTPGTLIQEKERLLVAVDGGLIDLLEVQFPGKRRMKTTEVLHGLTLSKSAHVL